VYELPAGVGKKVPLQEGHVDFDLECGVVLDFDTTA
jgi:hypothetical protein